MRIFKKVYAADFDADKFRARRQKAKQNRDSKKQARLIAAINEASSPTDKLQVLFEELVPSSGQADNLAGELTRACMKILYRDYNDGDVFYEGYGLETCGNAAQFLFNHIDDAADQLEAIALDGLTDEAYTRGLEKLTQIVVDYILNNPETFKEPTDDMYDTNIVEVGDWEPEYEYEPDTWELDKYVDNGCISYDDITDWLDNLCNYMGGYVYSWARDAFTIKELNSEQHEEWENSYGNELESWLRELESEFPNYGEEYDEDEYDEEDY